MLYERGEVVGIRKGVTVPTPESQMPLFGNWIVRFGRWVPATLCNVPPEPQSFNRQCRRRYYDMLLFYRERRATSRSVACPDSVPPTDHSWAVI